MDEDEDADEVIEDNENTEGMGDDDEEFDGDGDCKAEVNPVGGCVEGETGDISREAIPLSRVNGDNGDSTVVEGAAGAIKNEGDDDEECEYESGDDK